MLLFKCHVSKYCKNVIYILTVVTNQNAVFRDVTLHSSCKNGRFRGTNRIYLHPEGGGNMFLLNIGSFKSITASYLRRQQSSSKLKVLRTTKIRSDMSLPIVEVMASHNIKLCTLLLTAFRKKINLFIQAKQTNKQTPWPLVRKRTMPTERLVKFSANFYG
jgi:hypothetical protein